MIGLFTREESLSSGLVGLVKLGAGASQQVYISPELQISHEGGTDQSAMTSNKDFGAFIHLFVVIHGLIAVLFDQFIALRRFQVFAHHFGH